MDVRVGLDILCSHQALDILIVLFPVYDLILTLRVPIATAKDDFFYCYYFLSLLLFFQRK